MEIGLDNRLYICNCAFNIILRAIVSLCRDLECKRIEFLSVSALHLNSDQCVFEHLLGTMSSSGTIGFVREGFVQSRASPSQAATQASACERARSSAEYKILFEG